MHPRPDLLAEAVYGLPESHRDAIRTARLVANPGCFPEASILGPAAAGRGDRRRGDRLQERRQRRRAHADADGPLLARVADNVSAYKVYAHRHRPEIEQELGVDVTFTPHLVPVDRGLLSTCYARLTGETPHPDDLRERYRAFYADHPFVEVVENPPGMRAVQRTNYAQVCPMVDPRGGRVTAFGVIDNLGKGAAGQAVQNLNLMAGLPETEGLL